MFLIELIIVISSEILENNIILEDVVYRNQHGVCNSNICPLLATMAADPLELCVEIRFLVSDRRVSADDQSIPQEIVSFGRSSGFSSSGTLIVPGT